MIRYSAQTINNKDINSIKKVLKSDNLTQGPKVPEFEKRISSSRSRDLFLEIKE